MSARAATATSTAARVRCSSENGIRKETRARAFVSFFHRVRRLFGGVFQTVHAAERVDDRKDDDRAEVGGGVVLIEARGDLADVEATDLARAQNVLEQRQHDLGIESQRLRRADAGREGRGEHVRADGDVGVAAAVEEGVHALQNGLHVAALDLLGEHIVHAQLPRLFEQAHSVAVLLDADGEVVVRRALGPAHVRHLTEHRAGGIAHVVGAQVEVRVEVHDAELRRAALVLEVIVLALKVAEGRLVTAAEHDGEEPAAQYLLDREAQLTLALLEGYLVADDVARIEELDLLRKCSCAVK